MSAYLNLKRIVQQSSTANFPSLAELSQDVNVPGWHVESNRQNQVTFFKREKGEFEGQRLTLELDVQVQLSQQWPLATKYLLKSHNCETDLGVLLKLPEVKSPQALKDQILRVIQYLSCANLCSGILLEDYEETIALMPHIT